MHFIEMLRIEISVAKPAATTQIPLKFGGQMVGYDFFKHRGCWHTSKEERRGAVNRSHKGKFK